MLECWGQEVNELKHGLMNITETYTLRLNMLLMTNHSLINGDTIPTH